MKKILLITMISFGPFMQAQNFNEILKVVNSDRDAGDRFGWSIAASGNYAIVGAYLEQHDTNDANAINGAGSAYILERNSSGVWEEKQKLVPSNRATPNEDVGARFGYSVAIDGDYAIVGAYQRDVFGGAYDQGGAAYIFERNTVSGLWEEKAYLTTTVFGADDEFGVSVGISGDYAVVGAHKEQHDLNSQNSIVDAGSAFFFYRNNGNWNQVQKVTAPVRTIGDEFGSAVAIDGNYAVISARFEQEDSLEGGTTMNDAGSAYIFELNAGAWAPTEKITASDRDVNDNFGESISMSGDYIIVGAPEEDPSGLGAGGSAYIYERSGSIWNEVQKINSSDVQTSDRFGTSVSISEDFAIVGARTEKHSDTLNNNTMNSAGSAYIFHKAITGTWLQSEKIVASDRAVGDQYGYEAAITGSFFMIGAPLEDEDTTGLNTLSTAGSMYVYSCESYGIWSSTACDSVVSPSGNLTWYSSGTFTDTLPNAMGCDSIITATITILQSTSTTISGDSCYQFTSPSGRVWTNTGIHLDTIVNTSGCDSLITADITINQDQLRTIQPSACFAYTSPSGNYIWTSSATYMDTISTAAGCDSIITINLTINDVDTSITPSGTTLTSSEVGINYQWVDCDSNYAPISGATGQSFTASVTGSYALVATKNGCTDTSSCYDVIINSVAEYNSMGLQMYPNPTDGILYFDFSEGSLFGPLEIAITSLNGQIVSNIHVAISNNLSVDVSDLSTGVYFVHLGTEDKTIRLKLVKD